MRPRPCLPGDCHVSVGKEAADAMQRFDRVMGILLLLRSKQSISAPELARHFEVSTRTIYRDLDTLSALSVPLYAERGRNGGIRLLQGYFLPPLMFTRQEAIALLLGLTLQRSLRVIPFPTEIEMAERKLLAALPDSLRALLAKAEKLVAFEPPPSDIFHPEHTYQEPPASAVLSAEQADQHQSKVISVFFQAILDGALVRLRYASPYRPRASDALAEPL